MDKNNDIKVNKISKWDAAPKNMGTLFTYIELVIGMACSLPQEMHDNLYDLMDKTLDEYNELEAVHHKDTGMISEYEEENRNLKSELDIKTDECDALISRVFKQDEEYTKLKEENKELRMTCEPLKKVILKLQDEYNSIATENTSLKEENTHLKDRCNKLAYRGALVTENAKLRSECESKDDALQKMIKKVAELEKEKIDLEDRLVQQKRLEVRARVNASTASTYKSEIKQVIDLAKSYGLIIYDDRKDAIPDDVVNIGMCGHYYVLGNDLKNENNRLTDKCNELAEENCRLRDQRKRLKNAHIKLTGDNDYLRRERDRHIDLLDKLRWALEDKGIRVEWNEAALKWNLYDKTNNTCESCRQHFEDELRIREKEKDEKDKLIDELNQTAQHECEELHEKIDRLWRVNDELNRKIETLEKRNKNLKDLLEKDGEFGKNIGKRVADSIREGCDKGVYKLYPYTRIDIHVEETNSMPIDMEFGRYAIPRVSVIFNNTQTEMERDTAEHECEELNGKIKELSKENVDLKRTLSRCGKAAYTAKRLCNNITSDVERAGIRTPWYNDTLCNSRYLRKQGDDI